MRAVFRHELSSWVSNVAAYVFGGFLLLFAGIYTMSICLKSGVGNFEYVFANMSFVFLIIVPIITMRVIAEEKRQKTDQLLYSLPISMTEVVLGKYSALLTVFAVPVAITCIYPVVLTAYGDVYLPAVWASALGFFLLGAALLAIGMFISSITENQAAAAGLCFVVMMMNYYITGLASYVSDTSFASFMAFAVLGLVFSLIVRMMTKSSFAAMLIAIVLEGGLLLLYMFFSSSFAGLFPQIMEQMSLFERFYQFIYGVFDLRSAVYLISVSAVFVFLSVQSLEKRRWSE